VACSSKGSSTHQEEAAIMKGPINDIPGLVLGLVLGEHQFEHLVWSAVLAY
jgi:hypothetical protein